MDNLDERYLCRECKKFNSDPYQSDCCGTRYCEKCIQSDEKCVSCGEHILEDKSKYIHKKDRAFKREIDNQTINCSKCDWNGKLVDYQTHIEDKHGNRRCTLCSKDVQNTITHTQEYAARHYEMIYEKLQRLETQLASTKNSNFKNGNKSLKEILKYCMNIARADMRSIKESFLQLESETDTIPNKLVEIRATLKLHEQTLPELEKRFTNFENSPKKGVLLWQIRNFNEKFNEAKAGRELFFLSYPFFTSEYGYKFCARVYLNGDGQARGSHVSLFVAMMKGPYDNLLKWPFRQNISLILVDQSGKEDVIDSFKADPASKSFAKPINEMNVAAGIQLFCPHSRLFSKEFEYVKDDCLFIKVIVDTRDLIEV